MYVCAGYVRIYILVLRTLYVQISEDTPAHTLRLRIVCMYCTYVILTCDDELN